MHVVHYSNIVLLQTVRPACMHVYNNVVYIIMVPAVAYFWCASNVDVQVPRGGRTFDWETWTFSCFHTNVTNVTWRRNGIVITPNETYRQTVAQQYAYGYLSTLTIARSVPATDVYGTYSCTFERQHLTLDIVLYRKQICPKHDSIASVSSGRQSPDDRKLPLYLFRWWSHVWRQVTCQQQSSWPGEYWNNWSAVGCFPPVYDKQDWLLSLSLQHCSLWMVVLSQWYWSYEQQFWLVQAQRTKCCIFESQERRNGWYLPLQDHW